MGYVNLVVFLGLIGAVAAFNNCKPHSFYTSCADDCAPTCRNPRPRVCEFNPDCSDGCRCERGYFLNDHGDCVRLRECRRYRHRGRSSSTESRDKSSRRHSRDSSDDSGSTESRDKSSKSRDSDSDSDSKSREKKCGPNEKYGKCKQKCPETCKSKKPKSCDNKCRHKGCNCKDGFVKDKYDNCIPKGLCSSKRDCGRNEKWSNSTTVPPPICQKETCLKELPKYCPLYYTNGGCICKSGYLRNKKGNCVLSEDCNDSSSYDSDSRDKSTRSTKSSRKSKSSRRSKSTRSRDSDSYSCESWDSRACSDESISWEDRSRCCRRSTESSDRSRKHKKRGKHHKNKKSRSSDSDCSRSGRC